MNSLLVPLTPCARSCALSADGGMAVAGFDDGSLKVLAVKHLWMLSASNCFECVILFMQIWNVKQRQEVACQQTGSDYWMIDVAFSPDGKQVVTLCDSIQVT